MRDSLLSNLRRFFEQFHFFFQRKVDRVGDKQSFVKFHCFHPFAFMAEFERDVIRERTNAGLFAPRAKGRKGGRPKGVMDTNKQMAALALKNDASRSVAEICQILGVCRNTYYKCVRVKKAIRGDNGVRRLRRALTPHRERHVPKVLWLI